MAEQKAARGRPAARGSSGRRHGTAGHDEIASDEAGRREAGPRQAARDEPRHDDAGSTSHPDRQRGGGRMTAWRAARLGLQQISELTGKEAGGVAGVEPSDDGWTVGVEVIEERRIPSSTDVLAIYQAELDQAGDLISCRRVKRYKRGQGDSDYGGESW